jgi:beta-lactamase regulating signal transducer with metallopeptidase domain
MTAVVYQSLAEASAWWWPRFADHLWQTTLFALVILAAVFILRRGPARWRHAFCLIAAAKFIVPAALFVLLAQQLDLGSLSFFRAAQQTEQNSLLLHGLTEPVAVATYEVAVVAAKSVRHQLVYFALTAIWFTGSLTILLLWIIRRRRFSGALRQGRSVRSGREWQALERARRSLGWQRQGHVGLVISPLRIEPAVWRVWQPLVVLPESIAGQLDDDELEAIMLHELVHIQRRDNLIGNLQLVLCALLWFHPLVWFISRKLFDEREQACDEKVLEFCSAPEAYASSILKVVRFCFGWRVAGVTGAASGSNLRRRIENIMTTGNTKSRAGRASRLLASALVGLALLILVAVGLYTRPRAVSAAVKETVVRIDDKDESAALTGESASDKQSKKNRTTRQTLRLPRNRHNPRNLPSPYRLLRPHRRPHPRTRRRPHNRLSLCSQSSPCNRPSRRHRPSLRSRQVRIPISRTSTNPQRRKTRRRKRTRQKSRRAC